MSSGAPEERRHGAGPGRGLGAGVEDGCALVEGGVAPGARPPAEHTQGGRCTGHADGGRVSAGGPAPGHHRAQGGHTVKALK